MSVVLVPVSQPTVTAFATPSRDVGRFVGHETTAAFLSMEHCRGETRTSRVLVGAKCDLPRLSNSAIV